MLEKIRQFKIKKGALVVAVIILFACVYSSGYFIGKISSGKIELKVGSELYEKTALPEVFKNSLIEQVWTILRNDFVDREKIDEKKLYYGALKGFVSGLEDPYTVFLDPETTKEFDDQIAGSFEGIGAEIAIKDGLVTVVAPLPGTPAEQAGLLAGDKIYTVDGKEVIGLGLEKVVRMIRGPRGTQVSLLIVRGEEEPREVKITRGVIELKSVKWITLREDNIFYIALSGFNGDTVKLFDAAVKEILKKKPKGIILDLRNNPGGLLDTALEIVSYWVGDSQLVLKEKFGDGRETEYRADEKATLKGYPTVVLINAGSASGAEIVAGALQDYGLAKLVGQKSFGKGSVQALKKLPDGSSIKVTIAKWLTPKGRSINDEGIAPDVEVKLTKKDVENQKDPQLEVALEMLLKK